MFFYKRYGSYSSGKGYYHAPSVFVKCTNRTVSYLMDTLSYCRRASTCVKTDGWHSHVSDLCEV